MKILNYEPTKLVIGKGSICYLRTIPCHKIMIVTGGSSMRRFGLISRIVDCLDHEGRIIKIYEGIGKNPTIQEVNKGCAAMREFQPDTVIALGGGSPMDAAKAMVLFYEFPYLNFDNILVTDIPERRAKTKLICIPSTSGTASEVTKTTVITNPETHIKIPIIHSINKPDIAILDVDVVMSMPASISAETGMDALAHAIECYTRGDLDDFNEVLAKGAIEGILKWLPESVEQGTEQSREKVHYYQCMAGMAFTNVGVTIVHGISHSIGGKYNLAHGYLNALILPYGLRYNSQDSIVAEKLKYLSKMNNCSDIIDVIIALKERLGIPKSLMEGGIAEKDFLQDFDLLVEHAMLGATKLNPVPMTSASMGELIKTIYYGHELNIGFVGG